MGNNLLNMAGETHLHSAGDKLPESTGEDDSTLLGKLLDCTGEMAPLGHLYSAVEQFYTSVEEYQDCRGSLLGNICILRWGILRSSGDTQLP